MARPSHLPDELQRRQVEALASYGVPEADIAGMMEIAPRPSASTAGQSRASGGAVSELRFRHGFGHQHAELAKR